MLGVNKGLMEKLKEKKKGDKIGQKLDYGGIGMLG